MSRLRRSDSSGRGISRRRSGRGFTYHDDAGNLVLDPELKTRIAKLAIPPAWTDVWISPYPNGHILATGVDSAGRRQYIYHPTWRQQKDRIKFDRALSLAESLPTARRLVTLDLRSEGFTRERALAAGFRMLDAGSLRIGSEQYAEAHGSFGLTTLLCAHASVSADTVTLKFPAKSGQSWESEIEDADLAAVVRAMKRRGPTAHLLSFRTSSGWVPVHASDLNDYVRERTGGEFTAKDFRTMHGTVAAAISLARQGTRSTATARKKVVSQAMKETAAVLGNTPAIARGSYVDPRLIDEYDHERTIEPRRNASAESELRALLYS
jgi:DNA topoisomerase I